MAQFFDFSDAEMPDIAQAIADLSSAPSPQVIAATASECLIHPNESSVSSSLFN